MLTFLVALLGAFVPTVLYIIFIWWLDRYEKEPLQLLLLAFLWGAIPAALVSIVLEVLFDVPVLAVGGEGLIASLVSVSIGAPLIEESTKGIALIGLVLVFRHEFDNVLDGIIYGAMIGFGFAMTEDLLGYFLPILQTEGMGAGLTNILLRTVVFGFNHAFWTGITGAAVGGWALAVLLHSIHNAGVTLVEQTLCLSMLVSLVVDWGGLVLLLAVAFFWLRKERRWIERGLYEEVRNGVITSEELDLLQSAARRFWLRWEVRGRGGAEAYRAIGRYYQCATELAFKKQHLRTLGDVACPVLAWAGTWLT
jgi:RsiW-degrading membrane proteinase PrsW (M82 family)